MNRRVVAREWLILLGGLCVGVTVWPIAFSAVSGRQLQLFYEALVGGREWVSVWLFATVPYVVLQLGRSVAWAIRTGRTG